VNITRRAFCEGTVALATLTLVGSTSLLSWAGAAHAQSVSPADLLEPSPLGDQQMGPDNAPVTIKVGAEIDATSGTSSASPQANTSYAFTYAGTSLASSRCRTASTTSGCRDANEAVNQRCNAGSMASR